MSPFKRVLVANRGEIALRITRACHEEGLEAVAVYSEADRLSPHVRAADRAVPLGAAPASESYLNIPKLIAAARTTGCQALHPGYGFLSERAPFAEAVAAAGLGFVRPPPPGVRAPGGKNPPRPPLQAARGAHVPPPTQPPGRAGGGRPPAPPVRHPRVLAPGGEFCFLEMNTRLQVEHPVTELVYGVDIVREQLRIANGLPLRIHGGPLQPRGHAIECRITAEDPFNDFLPATGVVRYLRPPAGPGVRWDGGVEAGNEVTLFYDPLIAKLIAWGETREVALQRIRRALRELVIVGLPTSQAFHLRVMDEPRFRRGEVDSTYLERLGSELLAQQAPAELARPLAAVAALLAEERRAAAHPPAPSDGRGGRESAWVQTARRENLRGGAE